MRVFKLKIGLENHIKLSTHKKLFCSCINDSKSDSNTNTCAFCIACPGTLPVINMNAVQMYLLLCSNLNATACHTIAFNRKHYDYPDLPKGYQITQNTFACDTNAVLKVLEHNIRIEGINIEEDAAKSFIQNNIRYIDFNRCGSPLIEVTTAPDFENTNQVITYLKILRGICEDIGIIDSTLSDCIRCDVNISVGDGHISSERVEIKNVNSFSEIKQAIDYEFARLSKMLVNNEKTQCETRFWQNNKSVSGREKTAYIFMPEMDIPCFTVAALQTSKCILANNIEKLSHMLCVIDEHLVPYVLSKAIHIARSLDLNNVVVTNAKDIEILFALCKEVNINIENTYNDHIDLFRKLSIEQIVDRVKKQNFAEMKIAEKYEIQHLVKDIMIKFSIKEDIKRSDLQRFLMSKLSIVLKDYDISVVFKHLVEILDEYYKKHK